MLQAVGNLVLEGESTRGYYPESYPFEEGYPVVIPTGSLKIYFLSSTM